MIRSTLLVLVLLGITSTPIEYTMTGAIRHPGVVKVQADEPITLTRAIRISGGPTADADESAVRISHNNRADVHVDYGAIMRGERSDVQIETGDIIYLPFKPGK